MLVVIIKKKNEILECIIYIYIYIYISGGHRLIFLSRLILELI